MKNHRNGTISTMIFKHVPARMPVHLMASFARSGETVMLRALNAHPMITVAHQILEPDTLQAKRLVRNISQRDSLYAWVPASVRKKGSSLLLVKHGVWAHQFPHRGFTFARNPFAVVASMKEFARKYGESEDRRRKRLVRWADGIDSSLVDTVKQVSEVEALSLLYYSKMKHALSAGHPVFRYEDFTANPRRELKCILEALGLPWDEQVMIAESAYPAGSTGHGGIDLSRPIRTDVPPYSGDLTDAEFQTVARTTQPLFKNLGYSEAFVASLNS